jgi:superkiller protein 3
MGRAAQAAEDFAQAIRREPDSVPAHYNLALNLIEQKRFTEAARELEIVVRLQPALAAARFNLGSLYAQTGRLRAALPHMAEAHRLEPANGEAAYRLAEIYYHLSNYTAALALLAPPAAARDFYLAGLCHSAMGKAAPAIANLGNAVELAPANADYVYDYGIMLVNGQQDPRALAVFRAAAARFPNLSKMHFGRALGAYLNGQNQEAEAAMARAIELDPRPGEMWASLGDIYASLGRRQEALAAYRKAASCPPLTAAVFRKQGIVLDKMDDLPASRQAFERALAIDPTDAESQYGLAKLSLRAQSFDLAIRQFEKTVQLDPQNSAAYYQLALLYRKKNQLAKAEQALAAFRKLKAPVP